MSEQSNQPSNQSTDQQNQDVSGNRVASLEGVQELVSIEELWMGYNQVRRSFVVTCVCVCTTMAHQYVCMCI